MLIPGMQLRDYSAGKAVGSSALTFKVPGPSHSQSGSVPVAKKRYSSLPTIRLAPPYSYLISFLISVHTSAEQFDGAFVTEKNLNPEYACSSTPFLLCDTTGVDPDFSLK